MEADRKEQIVYFGVTEKRCANADMVLPSCDLYIGVASWEERCLEITKANAQGADNGILVCFRKDGGTGKRREHFNSLKTWMNGFCKDVNIIDHSSSTDYEVAYQLIADCIMEVYNKVGRPMRVVLDASCCPKSYMLFLFGFGVRRGLFSALSIFYAEGRYKTVSSKNSTGPQKESAASYHFTEGDWDSIQVPYFEGELGPERRRLSVVSLGFEAAQARKFLKRYESDEFRVILPYPGFQESYSEISKQQADYLKVSYGLDDNQLIQIAAGSVIDAATYLINNFRGLVGTQEIMFFCLGPKTHAISMGIVGIIMPEIPVICRIPQKYVETEASGNGYGWLYTIEDNSIPA